MATIIVHSDNDAQGELNFSIKKFGTHRARDGYPGLMHGDIYVNGQKLGIYSDSTVGGPVDWFEVDQKLFDRVQAYAKSLPALKFGGLAEHTLDMDIDLLIERLLQRHDLAKKVQAQMKKGYVILVTESDSDGEYLRYKTTPELVAKYIVAINKKHPDAIIANEDMTAFLTKVLPLDS